MNQEFPSFDLINYAEEATIKRNTPSYEELSKEANPRFDKFIARLRDQQQIPETPPDKFNIIVLGTGGTFQSAETDHGIAPEGTLRESFDALNFPEKTKHNYELFDLMNIDSSQAMIDHWRFLAEKIDQLYREVLNKFDFIIITHGTDTMSKAAAYLSFMLMGYPKPIIFTGSQIPARMRNTDAGDQMRRATRTGEIACSTNNRVTEVLVSCGSKTTRGTWATKQGDSTPNAFGPWNSLHQEWDSTDWVRAAQKGTLYQLAPHHLNFGGDKLESELKMPDHAITFERKPPYQPFFEITTQADLYPVLLTDKSPRSFAQHLINQRVAILTQLGSATADDVLLNIAMQAALHNKAIVFEAPFADSTIQAGHYAASMAVLEHLPNLQGQAPILNTSPSAFEAKINYLLHKLDMAPQGQTKGLREYFSSEQLRAFNDHLKTNMVGELV